MPTETREQLIVTASIINEAFKRGANAFEVRDQIRSFPRPILLDLNGVIVGSDFPYQLNPDTPAFMESLAQAGNVFIVTTATNWSGVNEFLKQQGFWSDDMVLMTKYTWEFMTNWDTNHNNPQASSLRTEYLQTAKALGLSLDEKTLVMSPSYKRVAPLFNKPFLLPLIDDSKDATSSNPGILGIEVKEFWPENTGDRSGLEMRNQNKPGLVEAAEIVRKHYSGSL